MKVGSVTVHETGLNDPIYISPEINGKDFENVWAMWVWNDGSADIYLKRKTTGAVLGKPIHLSGPKHEHMFAEDVSKEFRPCLGCGREYKTMFAGKKSPLTKVRVALDTIAVALADENHKWTKEERSVYNSAVRELSKFALEENEKITGVAMTLVPSNLIDPDVDLKSGYHLTQNKKS